MKKNKNLDYYNKQLFNDIFNLTKASLELLKPHFANPKYFTYIGFYKINEYGLPDRNVSKKAKSLQVADIQKHLMNLSRYQQHSKDETLENQM